MENNEQLDFDLDELLAMLDGHQDPDKDENTAPVENPVPEEISAEAEKSEQEDIPAKPVRPIRRSRKKAESWQKTVLMYLHDLIYLLGALMIVSLLLVRIVVVSGTSMNQTLLDGDYLFVLSNTIYHDPDAGDIVVVSKQSFDNGKPIVKRVIATEGQWVDIKDGLVYVGDTLETMEPLSESYTTTATTAGTSFIFPLQVEEGCIFCLGDNRWVSHDSRSSDIGMIDRNEVLGRVLFLFLPGGDENNPRDFGRIGVVN